MVSKWEIQQLIPSPGIDGESFIDIEIVNLPLININCQVVRVQALRVIGVWLT